MASTNARSTLDDIYLNVEITPLPYLNMFFYLKFFTIIHLICKILTLHKTIIIGNKILFKSKDNKKHFFFKKKQTNFV